MQIRSQHRLRTVLKTAFHLVTGDFTAYVTNASRDGVSLDHQPAGGPSATTLSRSRFKLDLFLMLTRQHQWRQWLMAHPQHPQPNVLQHADSNPQILIRSLALEGHHQGLSASVPLLVFNRSLWPVACECWVL